MDDGELRCISELIHQIYPSLLLCVYSPAMKVSQFCLMLLFVPFLFVAQAPAVFAQDHVASVLDSLPTIKKIDQVVISPDGKRVAYIVEGKVHAASASADSPEWSGPEAREVAWSPDSKSLVGLTDNPGEAPSARLWMATVGGADTTRVADLKGYAQTLRYSPDGHQIAVLFTQDMPRIAGPLQPMTPLSGVLGEKIYEQRITAIDLVTKKLTQVTPADVYVYEYDWTPDSKAWAAIAAHGAGDNNWWIARLYNVDAANGEMHEIYKPKWQIADPHVSPDGKNVAFIEGLMSDEGLTGGEVQMVPIAGGPARNMTPGIKASPSALAWTGADQIGFVANVDGDSGYGSVSTATTAANWKPSWTGEELIGTATDTWVPAASFSRDGSVMAVVRQSAAQAPEVWSGGMGEWKQVTHLNDGVKRGWGETRNVHWMNGDTRVEGWLMLPKDYNKSKRYPLIVSVHGGPSWACTNQWPGASMGNMAAASALGWFVLCPNPRGSYGQGEAFTQGNVKDFGDGDYKDIMAGVEAMIKQFPIDAKRIGIRGHSYGGYMTMWAETQTTRFAAAVAGAGLSDWTSYYGLNDIDEWMIPFFGASVYDDPAVYAKSDPIRFVKNVKTPTLILAGDSDGEVPMPQSLEWYHALQAMKVPTQMVVYPHEGHVFYKPEDARDYTLRMLQWFDKWFSKAE
jgi:dipeptidyl aminopeptidase/acylaminoacyl peptidase